VQQRLAYKLYYSEQQLGVCTSGTLHIIILSLPRDATQSVVLL